MILKQDRKLNPLKAQESESRAFHMFFLFFSTTFAKGSNNLFGLD
jgi:hypothetical protein